MKPQYYTIIFALIVVACSVKKHESSSAIQGTWKLLSGTLIEKGDTTVTNYTGSLEMIKIINATHFSFLNHDTKNGKDSTASFSAGGGRYELQGNIYTEHLEYCNDRQWEGHEFKFDVEVKDDTLIQRGKEVIEDIGVNRMNIEKYVRVK
jgi:hypothetical protein